MKKESLFFIATFLWLSNCYARGQYSDPAIPVSIIGIFIIFAVLYLIGKGIDPHADEAESVIIGFLVSVFTFVGLILIQRDDDKGFLILAPLAYILYKKIRKQDHNNKSNPSEVILHSNDESVDNTRYSKSEKSSINIIFNNENQILTVTEEILRDYISQRVNKEIYNKSGRDELLWSACSIETKNAPSSTEILYRNARVKFLFGKMENLLNTSITPRNLRIKVNEPASVTSAQAKKLAFTS